jgi:hypothetical protein
MVSGEGEGEGEGELLGTKPNSTALPANRRSVQ